MLMLASKSPRRRALLARLGVRFAVLEVDVPEIRASSESAHGYVRRVAQDKARAGLAMLPDAWVLGADTEVVLEDEVFGKPRDHADAALMLRRLSARTHEVLTAVTLVSHAAEYSILSRTKVSFTEIGEEDIAAYIASGEPMGKAGAYAIQGMAERFVQHLSGSFSGVMGLPLYDTAQLLRQSGIMPGFFPAQQD